jgi:hypothetical protein
MSIIKNEKQETTIPHALCAGAGKSDISTPCASFTGENVQRNICNYLIAKKKIKRR